MIAIVIHKRELKSLFKKNAQKIKSAEKFAKI